MQQHAIESLDPRELGRRLQSARRDRGLTQLQVADELHVSRTTITAIEKGERRTRPDELIRMARIYGRSVSDFLRSTAPTTDFSVQFRTAVARLGSVQIQSDVANVIQDFRGLCDDYRYLEILNAAGPRRSYPPQFPITNISPEAAAEDVATSERNRLGLGDGPLFELREILESDVGVRVFYMDLPSRVAGLFAYTDELGGCIAVNERHPEERRRWSMAHEYGHFLTSRRRSEISLLAAHSRVPAVERFADAFARSMLMPSAGLRRRFNEIYRESNGNVNTADICRLAHFYFTSVEAMMLRLEELRLLPAGTWDRLRDLGFMIREAQEQLGLYQHSHDDQSLPVRYQLLAVRAFGEGKLTEGELSRLLRTDRVSARRTVQKLTHPVHVADAGEVASLHVDLASPVSSPTG